MYAYRFLVGELDAVHDRLDRLWDDVGERVPCRISIVQAIERRPGNLVTSAAAQDRLYELRDGVVPALVTDRADGGADAIASRDENRGLAEVECHLHGSLN